MPKGMSPVFKGILLLVGSYVVTMAAVVLVIVLAITILMVGSPDCSVMNWALVALWVTIAVLLFASVAVLRIGARKVIPSIAGRRAVVILYGVVLLASYVVIAFGLLVAFEC